jgi:hypothetical protein
MPLITLTIQHGRTLEEARRRLETAVQEIAAKSGALVRRVEWGADRNHVKLEGVGFWVELWVDAVAVHVTGDAPFLGGLFGGRLGARLRHILEHTFQKQLR